MAAPGMFSAPGLYLFPCGGPDMILDMVGCHPQLAVHPFLLLDEVGHPCQRFPAQHLLAPS